MFYKPTPLQNICAKTGKSLVYGQIYTALLWKSQGMPQKMAVSLSLSCYYCTARTLEAGISSIHIGYTYSHGFNRTDKRAVVAFMEDRERERERTFYCVLHGPEGMERSQRPHGCGWACVGAGLAALALAWLGLVGLVWLGTWSFLAQSIQPRWLLLNLGYSLIVICLLNAIR